MTRQVRNDECTSLSSLEDTPAETSATPLDGRAGEALLPAAADRKSKATEFGHFATEHLQADLKGRSIRGGAVTLTAQGVKFVLGLGSTVVLARLLTPADFGLIAMVTALTGFVAIFKSAGLSMATVQRDQVNHAQVSTLFWINVALSLVLMLVVAALAPAIAWFYGEPELFWVTLAIAATFVLGGLAPQHQALLKRQMRFTAVAVKDIAALAAGIAVGVTLAWLGAGYWALVAMGATAALTDMVLVWGLSGWIPGRPRRGAGVRPMLVFGSNLTAARFCNYLMRNADNVLLGFHWGAGPLGLYAKAYQLLTLPLHQINAPVTSAAIPALSRLQSDPATFRRYYRRGLELVVTASLPIAVVSAVCAQEMILVALGPQWTEAVAIFRILAPAAMIGCLNIATAWIFVPLGQGGRHLKATMFGAAVTVTAFAIGVQWGAIGVATAFTLSVLMKRPLELLYATAAAPVTMADIARSIWRPSIAAGLGAMVALVVLWAVQDHVPAVRLVATAAVFGLAYCGLVQLLPGSIPIRDLWQEISRSPAKQKNG